MKFAKVLEQTLIEEEIPDEWVGAAIQYKALKKCINKVVNELKFLGLGSNTLKLLLDDSKKIVELDEKDTIPLNPVIAEYTLTKSKNETDKGIAASLKITLDYSNQDITDDYMVESGKHIKQKIEAFLNSNEDMISEESRIIELKEEDGEFVLSPQTSRDHKVEETRKINEGDKEKKMEIYIVLNSDAKFFQMLNDEVHSINTLRNSEEAKLVIEVQDITQEIKSLVKPKASLKRSDLYKWRELFKIYLDSEVYFKYNESDNPSLERSVAQIKEKLDCFVRNVNKAGILGTFKNKKSIEAYDQFVSMNYHLLKILNFQSINSTAFRKILKKFDKQTSLGIKYQFPKLLTNDHIFSNGTSLAHSICYIIQTSLLILIPQLDDYTCPICCSIAFKPIKLECGHVFCVRCLVKLKQHTNTNCPICRYEKAIELADSSNLDLVTMELMRKYFPIEVKEKMQDRDKEKYEEVMGNSKCIIV